MHTRSKSALTNPQQTSDKPPSKPNLQVSSNKILHMPSAILPSREHPLPTIPSPPNSPSLSQPPPTKRPPPSTCRPTLSLSKDIFRRSEKRVREASLAHSVSNIRKVEQFAKESHFPPDPKQLETFSFMMKHADDFMKYMQLRQKQAEDEACMGESLPPADSEPKTVPHLQTSIHSPHFINSKAPTHPQQPPIHSQPSPATSHPLLDHPHIQDIFNQAQQIVKTSQLPKRSWNVIDTNPFQDQC